MSQSNFADLSRFFEREIKEECIQTVKGVSTYSLNVSLADMELYKAYLSRKTPVQVVRDPREEWNVLKTMSGDLPLQRINGEDMKE
jgi:hypothetical protein